MWSTLSDPVVKHLVPENYSVQSSEGVLGHDCWPSCKLCMAVLTDACKLKIKAGVALYLRQSYLQGQRQQGCCKVMRTSSGSLQFFYFCISLCVIPLWTTQHHHICPECDTVLLFLQQGGHCYAPALQDIKPLQSQRCMLLCVGMLTLLLQVYAAGSHPNCNCIHPLRLFSASYSALVLVSS